MSDLVDQLAFDLSEPLEPWTGSPLRYHTEFLRRAEHEAAFDRWVQEQGRFGCVVRSRMWHSWWYDREHCSVDGHDYTLLSADCRRGERDAAPLDDAVPDALMYQSLCERCAWHSIHTSENAAVEAWHDHAVPGWRRLPAVPLALSGKRRDAWIEKHYRGPLAAPGSPIRTERASFGTRHVPGRSPFGGYDLGVPCQQQQLEDA